MKITVLVDNRTSSTLQAEWGLSLHLQCKTTTLLLDAGASPAFADNARRLGIDLAEVHHAVLSHHHFDHGDGLLAFFACNSAARRWCAPPPEGLCFSREESGHARLIDLSEELREQLHTFTVAAQPTEIEKQIHLIPVSTAAGNHPCPRANTHQFLRCSDGRESADDFSHELMLVVDEDDGLVVLTGCAHSGVCNMVEKVEKLFPTKRLKLLAGGFHLFHGEGMESREEIEEVGRFLLKRHIDAIWTGHCTSTEAFNVLKEQLRERLFLMECGAVIHS